MSSFYTRNKPDWDQLEQLLRKAKRSPRRLSPLELSQLDLLYRRACVQLAQVNARTSDADLLGYLNELVARAHSLIYLPPRTGVLSGCGNFVARGFPRLILRTWQFHAVSLCLLVLGFSLGYWSSLSDPMIAYSLLPANDSRVPGADREDLLEALRSGRDGGQGEKTLFASFLFQHNFKVGLTAMATGVLLAIPTTFLMLYNGMMLGAFTSVHHEKGIYAEFWAWLLPHGITELSAIVLCGGMGLMMGWAVIAPKYSTRKESIRRVGGEIAKMAVGVGLMLVFAAVVESFVRQSQLSTAARLAFAGGTLLFWVLYLVLAGRSESTQTSTVEGQSEDLKASSATES